MISTKNENIAPMWMNKVVTQLIDKHLVTGINRSAGDHLAFGVRVTRINLEILSKNLRWSINGESLPGAFDSGKGEEEEIFLGGDVFDHILVAGDNVDVVTTPHHK